MSATRTKKWPEPVQQDIWYIPSHYTCESPETTVGRYVGPLLVAVS